MTVIIGFGFVGQAVYNSLVDKHSCLIIDHRRGTRASDEYFQSKISQNTTLSANTIDAIFVCVDTPMSENGEVDISNFAMVYEDIKKYEGLIIIKSTIPKHLIPKENNWVMNPEFLNANTAKEDFINQEYIILGGEIDFTTKAKKFYIDKTNIEAKNYELCTKDEASDFKYLRNIKQAYNLMYWEFVQDQTGNSRKIAQMMRNMPVGENDLVGMDGFRGFGGACLPKDIAAFNNINEHKLTKFLLDYNKDL